MNPLLSKILTIAAASSCAAAFAVGAAGCGSSDKAESTASGAAKSVKNALDPVAQAAETTDAQKGGIAMTIKGSMSAGGQTIPLNGSGVFDKGGKLGSMTTTISAAGKTVKLDEVIKGKTVYVHSDELAKQMPGGKSWMKVDIGKAAASQGLNLDALGGGGASQDPTQVLTYLKGAGQSRKIGTETINGTSTTHYHVDVDLKKAAEKAGGADAAKTVDQLIKMTGTSTLPLDVWIDGQHLVRREQVKYDMTIQGQKAGVDLTIDMTKYGAPVTAKAPSDDQVVDLTDLAAKGLSGAAGNGNTAG